NYHWARSSNPLALDIGSNLSSDSTYSLDGVISDWNWSEVLSVRKVPGAHNRKCGPVSGRVEVCNDTYGNRGWLGIAQIWASGDHITQGTVQLNDSYLLSGGYNSPAWRRLVTCQELGHTFGLDHQDENFSNPNLGTCMDYTNSPDSNQHPNSHDYEQLFTIYTHLDGSSGGGGGGGGSCPPKNPHCSGNGVGNAPPFSQASRANGSVYVDRLPGGVKRITHVFWTPRGD
ncbi:MAG: hypothetical protein OEV72_06340, partial [Thermoleophilia bacterium]|nr:hypothetical protein [Thermoleophilia bacterium]